MALLGAAAYGIFLAAMTPAAFLASKLHRPGMPELSEVEGTLWRGSARAIVRLPTGAALDVERVAWRFLPSRLVAARLAFDVTARGPGLDARAELARGFGGYEAHDAAVNADAAAIARIAPWVAPWQPRGKVEAHAPRLAWDERELRGEARADWKAAAISLPQPQALGSYRAELRGEGGPARVAVRTVDGALRIAGEGTWAPGAPFDFRGEARADPAAGAALDPLLDLMGPRRADGARALEWRIR